MGPLSGGRRRGGAAIEFALVLPVLVTLLTGIIEYSWLFLQESNMVSAVREGVRLGVTVASTASPSPTSTATTRARSVMTSYGLAGNTATIDCTTSGTSPGKVMTMTITTPYTPLIGLLPTPSNLRTQATMLLESQ